jgi:hypothetical protein
MGFAGAYSQIIKRHEAVHNGFLQSRDANPETPEKIEDDTETETPVRESSPQHLTEPERIATDEGRSYEARFNLLIDYFKGQGMDFSAAFQRVINNFPTVHRNYLSEANEVR